MNLYETALILNKLPIAKECINSVKNYLYRRDELQEINIEGIPKTELLFILWEKSKPAMYYKIHSLPFPEFDSISADHAVLGYIDYFCGRLIKSDISKNLTHNIGYNREYGKHTYEKYVISIQKKYKHVKE